MVSDFAASRAIVIARLTPKQNPADLARFIFIASILHPKSRKTKPKFVLKTAQVKNRMLAMKRIVFLLVVMIVLCCCGIAYAFDWRDLHEQADRTDLKSAEKSAKQNPSSVEDTYVLGLVYLNLHKDKEALGEFDRILSLDPDSVEARWGRAEVLRRQHNLSVSQKLLEDIIKDKPDFYPAYVSLAYLKYLQMDFDEAARIANIVASQKEKDVDLSNKVRAISLYAGSKGMIAHYGGPLSKLINGTAVKPALNRAERLQPNSAGVMFGLGSFYLIAPAAVGGDPERSEKYLLRAIEIDPLFADAYVRLGQFYKTKGDEDRYSKYLRKALEIDPGNELAIDVKEGKCRFICF